MKITYIAASTVILGLIQTAEPRRISGTLDDRLVAEGLNAQIELNASNDRDLPRITAGDRVFRAKTPQFRPAAPPDGLAVALVETTDKTFDRFLPGQAAKATVPRRFDTMIQLESTAESSANVSMGDLDADGDLDIVLAKGRHDPLLDRVLINDGKGTFTASDLGPTPDRTYTAALADLDGDGDLDVITSNDTPDRKMVYLNDGKARFTVAGTWGVPEWSTRNATLADLNNDGRADVIAANRPGPSFVCLNDGAGRFKFPCIAIPAESATSIVAADFDKDGSLDLAVPSRDGGQSRIYFNDGKAGFTRTLPFGPADAAARVAAAADFNRDGSVDLAVGDEKAASITVYLNEGRGRLVKGFHVANKARTPYAIAAADLNNDQWPDIVLGYTAGPHSALFNDGSGRSFTEVKFGDVKGAAYGFAIGDIDGDTFNDIALARSGAPNVLYLNGK